MITKTSLMCLVASLCLSGSEPGGQSTLIVAEWQQKSSSASVSIDATKETWTFVADRDGLVVRIKGESGEETVRPKALASLKRITRIVASCHEGHGSDGFSFN